MRAITAETAAAWKSAVKTGDQRANVRVTVQRMNVKLFPYEVRDVKTVYSSMMFGQGSDVRELPNVKSLQIQASTEQDVQTCRIELVNASYIPIGTSLSAEDLAAHERPGWFTFNKGETGNPWGLSANSWQNWLVPDRIVRTYEGYGIDPDVAPDKDPNMYLSGVWLIDDITMSADGSLTLVCRDLARELVECVLFPPIVPWEQYPLVFEKRHKTGSETVFKTGALESLKWETDSGQAYVGVGFTDGAYPYIDADGAVRGHHGRKAFDGDKDSYWMSVGNDLPTWTSAYEYVQGTPKGGTTVQAVRIHAWGGPYEVFISIKKGGVWLGENKIPYRHRVVDADSDVRFKLHGKVGRNKVKVFAFKKPIDNVEAIRVTLHATYDSKVGDYSFRAGLFDVRYSASVTKETHAITEGNYDDYTDIVKTLLAWGGFYWPNAATGQAFIRSEDGTAATMPPLTDDPVLGYGRVWGDLEDTGVGGEDYTKLESQIWDQKPIIDGIHYVKDIVGYVFFVDETGGAVFRSPNIWKYGNYMSGEDGGPNTGRTTDVLVLKDDEVILGHSLTLSSRNKRDRVFVGSPGGSSNYDPITQTGHTSSLGAVARGYDPFPSGTRRVGGWTDSNFESQEEVEVMASLIAVRQALKFRTVQVEIPANPAIQIDDQVVVQERVTGTNHLFYVESITKNFDGKSGRHTYSLTLNWLGTPTHLMTVQDIKLLDSAKAYIKKLWGG